MFSWLRLKYKLFVRQYFLIDSFCRKCGGKVRDFNVSDES